MKTNVVKIDVLFSASIPTIVKLTNGGEVRITNREEADDFAHNVRWVGDEAFGQLEYSTV